VECFEEIPCNVCEIACPADAISLGHVPRTHDTLLTESKCISCGICVRACPSGAIPMIQEREDRSTSQITLPWRGPKPWKVSDTAILLNRRGDTLGSARVVLTDETARPQLVTLDVPTHLVWEARGLKRGREAEVQDLEFLAATQEDRLAHEKVEILLNGEKRVVRDAMPVSLSLFEVGRSRPGDTLLCSDGSCGMCELTVDGVKKLGCQTLTHRGMSVRAPGSVPSVGASAIPGGARASLHEEETAAICPCLGITKDELVERMRQGKLQSPDAVISLTHVGEGKCHGQLCMEAVRRTLVEEGLDAAQWVDWRFPWTDWEINQI
jgi:ferredoxin